MIARFLLVPDGLPRTTTPSPAPQPNTPREEDQAKAPSPSASSGSSYVRENNPAEENDLKRWKCLAEGKKDCAAKTQEQKKKLPSCNQVNVEPCTPD